jgi:hypothetical protein
VRFGVIACAVWSQNELWLAVIGIILVVNLQHLNTVIFLQPGYAFAHWHNPPSWQRLAIHHSFRPGHAGAGGIAQGAITFTVSLKSVD